VKERIRNVLNLHGRLPVAVDGIDDNANLYAAGMTSHASVNVMLALEEEFDVEFPDAMLTRNAFESIDSIAYSLSTLGVA